MISAGVYVRACASLCAHVRTYVCVYVCMYVCMQTSYEVQYCDAQRKDACVTMIRHKYCKMLIKEKNRWYTRYIYTYIAFARYVLFAIMKY